MASRLPPHHSTSSEPAGYQHREDAGGGPLPYHTAPGAQSCVVASEEQGHCFWQDLLCLAEGQAPEHSTAMGSASFDESHYLKSSYTVAEEDCFHVSPLCLPHDFPNHAHSGNNPNPVAAFGNAEPTSHVSAALPDTFCPEPQAYGHRTAHHVPHPGCYASSQMLALSSHQPPESSPEVDGPYVAPALGGHWEFGVPTNGLDRSHGTLEPEQGAAFPTAQRHEAAASTSGDPRFSSACLPGVSHSAGPWGDFAAALRRSADGVAAHAAATTATTASSSPRLSKDERKARSMKIPMSVSDIVALPATELAERRSRLALSEAQMSLVRDIRRRGKNKAAAHNCRQRKLQGLAGLEGELGRLGAQREQLLRERWELEGALRDTRVQLHELLHGGHVAPGGRGVGGHSTGGVFAPNASDGLRLPHFSHAT
ncbi:uncharacterized protein LOC142929772 [Petromyzon marinus]|uniref:uncharacterized protein LOC142929772 n=1 Tax=Petromyzon marinus TaxID=7757 RepID=UPI003F726B6B